MLRDVATRAAARLAACIRARAPTSSASVCRTMLDERARSRCCRRKAISRCSACSRARGWCSPIPAASRRKRRRWRCRASRCATTPSGRSPSTQGTNTLVGRDRERVAALRRRHPRDRRQARPRARILGRACRRTHRRTSDAVARRALDRRRRCVQRMIADRRTDRRTRPRMRDRQRADDRRRGLFPGLGVRAVHRAASIGSSMRMPGRAQRRAHPRAARRRGCARDLLHARLDRRALPGAGPAHRRRTATSSRATASVTSARREQSRDEFLADIRLAKAILEDVVGTGVRGYRAPSFSIGPRNPWAFDVHRRGRLSLQLEHLPDPPRPLRHARMRRASRTRCVPGCSRFRSRRCACCGRNWPAGGGGYFRLLPYALSRWSIRRVNARRPAAGDVLFPPVGARSRAAARRGHRAPRRAFATTSTSTGWSRARRGCCAISAGAASTGCFSTARVMDATRTACRHRAGASRRRARARVRRRRRARWDRLRRSLPRRRRSSTAPAGATSSKTSSAIARHYLLAERGGAIVGVLPLAEVKSRLFGHALVSLPFGVYGGRRGQRCARRRER